MSQDGFGVSCRAWPHVRFIVHPAVAERKDWAPADELRYQTEGLAMRGPFVPTQERIYLFESDKPFVVASVRGCGESAIVGILAPTSIPFSELGSYLTELLDIISRTPDVPLQKMKKETEKLLALRAAAQHQSNTQAPHLHALI